MPNDFSLDANCKALWRLENGALTVDSKGGNTLTNSGVDEDTIDYKEGACSGVWLLANSDYMNIAHADLDAGMPLTVGYNSFSICSHFKINTGGIPQVIFSKGAIPVDEEYFGVEVSYIGSPFFQNRLLIRNNSSGSFQSYSLNFNLLTDNWYHFGITFNGNDDFAYRIRVWDEEADLLLGERTGVFTQCPDITAADYLFGKKFNNTTYLDGKLDETVMFNRIISAAEIDQIRAGTYGGGPPSAGKFGALSGKLIPPEQAVGLYTEL